MHETTQITQLSVISQKQNPFEIKTKPSVAFVVFVMFYEFISYLFYLYSCFPLKERCTL